MSGLRRNAKGLRRDTNEKLDVVEAPAVIKGILGTRRANVLDIAGWDSTGVHDMASGFELIGEQSAASGVPLDMQSGIALLGRTVEMADGFVFNGYSHGAEGGDPAHASILHFDHPGKGLVSSGSGAPISLTNLTTKRTQPPVVSGQPWVPIQYDYDLWFPYINDLRIKRLTSLGSSNGVFFNGGRNNIEDWFGQFFENMFRSDFSYDTCDHSSWHGWPVSLQFAEARAYAQANLLTIIMGRCDNWFMSEIFSIWHKQCWNIRRFPGDGNPGHPAGTASKLKITNADIDIGGIAYHVAADADGHTAEFSGFSCQGPDGSGGGPMLHVEGPNTRIIGNFSPSDSDSNLIRCEASSAGGRVSLLVKGSNYNRSGAGFPAIEVAPGGAHVDVLPGYSITNGNGAPVGSGDITFWNEPGSSTTATGPGGAGYVPYDPDYAPVGSVAEALNAPRWILFRLCGGGPEKTAAENDAAWLLAKAQLEAAGGGVLLAEPGVTRFSAPHDYLVAIELRAMGPKGRVFGPGDTARAPVAVFEFVGDGAPHARTLTRRLYRGSAADPKDAPITPCVNIQYPGCKLHESMCIRIANGASGWDSNVLVGSRLGVVIDATLEGEAEGWTVHVDATRATNLPETQAEFSNTYASGADGFVANFPVWRGGKKGVFGVLGALPKPGLAWYGSRYKKYITATIGAVAARRGPEYADYWQLLSKR